MAAEEKPSNSNVEEILKSAQNLLAKITELAEAAKGAVATTDASRDASIESQKLIATALSDAKTKLTEIAAAATQAVVEIGTTRSSIAESQKLIDANVAESKAKLAEIIAAATQALTGAGTSRDAATESQKQIAAALNDATAKLAEITTAATQAVAAKTKITDDQAVIATKSAHINDAQKHADTVRADLDRQLTSAKQQATAAEAQQSKAQSSAENAIKSLAEVQKNKGAVETDILTIVAARKTAEESAALTKGLADKSATTESRIADYEKRLDELEKQCAAQLKEIENLLPGATGAGLATSFNERRNAFLKPHNRWQWVFVCSVLAIVGLAISGLWHVYSAGTPPTYDELFRLWLSRLPVAGALVWLAVHASHESALAKRLEEDYGYKAAVASCLLGFQKQVSEVGKDAVTNPSLTKLLDNTLTIISTPPGRIYDKHKLIASPSGELTAATKAAIEMALAEKLGPK
jgi:hypothetical protein